MTFTCPNCRRIFNIRLFPFHCSCHWVCVDARDPGRLADVTPAPSVGSELTLLLAELGLRYKPDCGCHAKAMAMDAWGPEGCVGTRELIIAWLEEAYETAGWLETIRAGWRGAWTLNPLDPFGSLLDEAMRRAEATAALPLANRVMRGWNGPPLPSIIVSSGDRTERPSAAVER